MTKNILLSLFTIAVLGGLTYLVVIKDKTPHSIFGNDVATTTDQMMPVVGEETVFECTDGKNIIAAFGDSIAQIQLSDGRDFTLEQTISASGARYANEGEEVVFWNKGTTAFVEEKGVATYQNCAIPAVKPAPPTPPPPAPTSATVTVKLNQTTSALGVKIVPLEILEDSRCPLGVMCIQAGTVRLRTQLTTGMGAAEQVFILNQPVTTESEVITLIQVEPIKRRDVNNTPGQYVFTFEIKKR